MTTIRIPVAAAPWLGGYNRDVERAIDDVTGAGQWLGIRSVTASGTVRPDDFLILANATGGAITVTLPAAVDSRGRVVEVKKTDASANAVTLDGNGAETIDGAANKSTTTQYAAFTAACDGTEWWLI